MKGIKNKYKKIKKIHNRIPPRKVGNYQAQNGVNNGPIANHLGGRADGAQEQTGCQKLSETVLKKNPERRNRVVGPTLPHRLIDLSA